MAGSSDLRSKLGKVKGLGAAHHGVSHWWLQRVTAVAIIPLALWFVYSLITSMLSPDVVIVAQWFASPVNALFTSLLLVTAFFHAKLGFQVVVEDYVKHPVAKYALLLANNFASIGFSAMAVLAILKLHFLYVAAGSV